MFGFPKWLLAASIAGLVGAAIWAGISYATNYEIGYIAWAIGGMVGVAVRYVAGEDQEGAGPGLTAAIVAILAVLGGKFVATSLLVSSLTSGFNVSLTDDDMMMGYASELARERLDRGQHVAFENGKSWEKAESLADFPADIRQQATAKWQAMPAEQRQKEKALHEAALQAMVSDVQSQLRSSAFADSFSLFDGLWFFLAAGTAYRLGAGNVGDDD
jgi:phosphate/sulfate permease